MWQQSDDGQMRDWESALSYAENLELGGFDNWRLPNAKELQSVLDYTRSPQSTGRFYRMNGNYLTQAGGCSKG